jgi:hypothetical protein
MIPPVIKTVTNEVQTWLARRADRLGCAVENFFRPLTDQIDWDFESSPAAESYSFPPAAGDGPRQPPHPPAGAGHSKPPAVTPADVILAHSPYWPDPDDSWLICTCGDDFYQLRHWANHVAKQLNQLEAK